MDSLKESNTTTINNRWQNGSELGKNKDTYRDTLKENRDSNKDTEITFTLDVNNTSKKQNHTRGGVRDRIISLNPCPSFLYTHGIFPTFRYIPINPNNQAGEN